MDTHIDQFVSYLANEKSMAKNSLDAYRRDANEFQRFLAERGIALIESVKKPDVNAYISKLKSEGRAGSTVNRKVAAIRAYSDYLYSNGVLNENPMAGVKSPKIERKKIEYLTIDEVEAILNAPDKSLKGMRDKAILELLYATGIRVTEITEMNIGDINFRIGFVTCNGDYGKARIIPMGRICKEALESYIYDARPQLINGGGRGLKLISTGREDTETEILFVNYYGEKLTRQGLWKIMKQYASKAGINKTLTPQILRNSFAVHMVQNGADLKSIQELMGHEDITTTQVYLGVTKNRIKEVYDRSHPRAKK
jgi:integrase/recombinase XerD